MIEIPDLDDIGSNSVMDHYRQYPSVELYVEDNDVDYQMQQMNLNPGPQDYQSYQGDYRNEDERNDSSVSNVRRFHDMSTDNTSVNLHEDFDPVEPSFKLQDAPLIREKNLDRSILPVQPQVAIHNDLDDSYLFEEHDVVGEIISSNNAPARYVHIPEPSPQLPPPTSAPQRLTMPNGEEFISLRKGLATDSKSPVEYTLHIVFTQFVRHAEHKLNMCLEIPVQDEALVIDLLAEGNGDSQFDKIISSLGYIARKKPKPIIDLVMFWRKSKSEVASMAATEVERILMSAKENLDKFNVNNGSGPPVNPTNTKSKRSLSLMRSKSISRIRDHRRNQSTSSTSVPTAKKSEDSMNSNNETEWSKQRLFYDDQFNQARETALQAERKSLASIYILCRVLIEVVKQTSSEVMGDDLGGKLEEIVFTQLKTTDPISTSESLLRSANWNLFAELLGCMSEKRFLSVSDRFIADLEKIPEHVNHEDEPRLHLLIHGMRYLKLTNYPLEVFEESAEFIESLAKFFKKARNESIILAYCEVLTSLLTPLANILTAEANHPTWASAIETIFGKAYFIWNKSTGINGSTPERSGSSGFINLSPSGTTTNGVTSGSNVWESSINLLTACLAVSRRELFQSSWFEIIEDNIGTLRPKVDIEERTTFITSIDRLIWVYLFRFSDTLNNTIKKLDNLFDLLFFNAAAMNKKNQWITSDIYLVNALSELITMVGSKHLNHTLDNVVLKLLKLSFNGSNLENFKPEKVNLVVKSYMGILVDYELGEKPEFPLDDALKRNFSKTFDKSDFGFAVKNSDNAVIHEEIVRSFGSLLKMLDAQYGCYLWGKEGSTPTSGTFPKAQSPFSAFHFGIDFSYQTAKNLNMELFTTLIEAVPWTLVPIPSGVPFKTIVEILTRNAVHSNFRIANAAVGALRHLASRKNPSTLLNYFAKFAFQLSDKPTPTYDSTYLNSTEFHRLLKLYVELLNSWLKQFKQRTETKVANNYIHPMSQDDELMSKDVLNDLYQINYKTDDLDAIPTKLKASDELEWKTIITVIEEIEGNGLFFLCSQDSKIRYYGISILKLVEQFDQEIHNATEISNNPVAPANTNTPEPESRSHSRSSSKFAADFGTRLIHVLEQTEFSNLINPMKAELSAPERNRLVKLKHKKSVLIRLAESDYGIDSTLWFRVYPKLLDIFFEKCPLPVAFCRSIVCVRLVQMHEQIFDFSESSKNYTSSLFSRPSNELAPEVLVDQWRLYLIFACCSLTSTNEQKITFPSQPSHGRKKSLQMFIQHQKITSAKSIFRMVLPLLKCQQPMVKDSVISGLSCININIFKTLLENVQSPLGEWDVDPRPKDPAEDRLRIEIIHILSKVTTRFGAHNIIYNDEWMIANLVSIIKSVKNLLSTPSVQVNVEYQKLRRYFCVFLERVFIGLEKKADLNRWLPFEARIGCLNYLREWCGFGDSKGITEERFKIMRDKCNQSKNLASAAAILEVERNQLLLATLSCMATILSGSITQQIDIPGNVAVMSFDVPSLMNWLKSLLITDTDIYHGFGKRALANILRLNPDNTEIYEEVLKQCYTAHDNIKTTESYYTTFVNFLMTNKLYNSIPGDLLCLVTFLIGDDSPEVREYSMKLLVFLESKFFNLSSVSRFSEAVTSKNKVVYKKALFEISVHLASLQPEHNFERISYFTMCFNVVSNNTRRDILSCLLPWVQTVELAYNIVPISTDTQNLNSETKLVQPINELTPASIMVLNNLFEITVKFSSTIVNEVEALWVALGSKPGNFDKIVEYLMTNSLERKNSSFVGYARQIIDYLSYSQADMNVMVDKLIANLQPKALIPPRPHSLSDSFQSGKEFPYIANLWELIPYSEKDASFSLGQISLIFLVDLFTSDNDRMINKLPLLLHSSFSLLDHYLPPVQEAASALLRHILHCLAFNDPKTSMAINKLSHSDQVKYLWIYDDLDNDKKGARTPKNMDLLVRNCLEILTPIVSNLQEEWSRVALSWATTCAVRHIACRSFQVFRSLLSFIDQSMLKDMLHRLSNTISDETPDIQGFAMQILMTLNAINAELDSEKLIDFPQLFWSGVACLSTIHEQEFIEVLSAMSKFVSKIDLDSPETVSCLISTFPPKWEGRFEGLQQVVTVGLRSATAYEQTIKFLDKLNTLQDSEIIGQGDSRLVMTIVSNLHRFLHAMDLKTVNFEVESSAMLLSTMCERNNKPSLARIFVSLAKNRFRSKKDFLVQIISSMKAVFFPEYGAQILVTLLSFLTNKIKWIKLETLSILKHIFPLVDLQREEFVGVGADLISPLLRLLLTEYAEPALEVLDETVSISGSQLDKDVLRMSLGNTSMKKEYEKTATLFGIPDDSGWAIPMPAVTASSTRNNVHAVFLTCTATFVQEEPNDEEIQFHREDYHAPVTDNASAVDEKGEAASLSHMWAALDDFDLFFTKENDPMPISNPALRRGVSGGARPHIPPHLQHLYGVGLLHAHHSHSASVDTKLSTTSEALVPLDSAPFVYDKKASVILNRSLARTQSNSSFKTSLADSIGNQNYRRTPTSPLSNKRSYIPFRNGKHQLKNRDAFTTPVMPTLPTFEVMDSAKMNLTPSTVTAGSTSDELLSGAETPKMLDSFLGNNKKRNKRVVRQPGAPIEAELLPSSKKRLR